MTQLHARIGRNLDAVRQRIAAAAVRAGRSPDSVKLIAVTKAVGIEEVRTLCDLGVQDLGENRVNDARPKIEALDGPLRWHMIGPIQRRKAKDVVALFDTADAIDRLEVAEALQRRCEEQDRRLNVLVEVNVSGESQKHGFTPDALEGVLEQCSHFDRLTLDGFMTMAPWQAEEQVLREVFSGLRRLVQDFGLREVSMGMSDDFETAVEEGATQVRIGTALYV